MGPLSLSITLNCAGKACQQQTLKLIGDFKKFRRKMNYCEFCHRHVDPMRTAINRRGNSVSNLQNPTEEVVSSIQNTSFSS
jgi:hypothetical protein